MRFKCYVNVLAWYLSVSVKGLFSFRDFRCIFFSCQYRFDLCTKLLLVRNKEVSRNNQNQSMIYDAIENFMRFEDSLSWWPPALLYRI